MIYAMTEKGAQLLAETDNIERTAIKWQRHLNVVQPTHIQHLLEVNDILITFRTDLEIAKHAGRIADYRVLRGDPKKHRLKVQLMNKTGHREDVSVIPDAIVLLQPQDGQHGVFFVEVDRGTMTTGRWVEKVEVYRDYSQGHKLQADWRSQWAILLAVTPSEKRLLSIAQKTVEAGGRRGFWFTTEDCIILGSVLTPIWTRGTDLFQLRNEKLSKLATYADADRQSLLDALR